MKAGYVDVSPSPLSGDIASVFLDLRGVRSDVFLLVFSSDRWNPICSLYGSVLKHVSPRGTLYVARFTFRGLFRLLYAQTAFASALLDVARRTPSEDVTIFYAYPFLRRYLASVDVTFISENTRP